MVSVWIRIFYSLKLWLKVYRTAAPGEHLTFKHGFVLVAPLISGNCLSPALFLFALFLPSTFASCLGLPVDIISGLPSLSTSLTICLIQNNQQTLFKLLLSNIYFLIMSVFLLLTTCSFPPAVSVFPACSPPLTYIHPQCHYSSFLSYSVLLFLPSFLLSLLLSMACDRKDN